MQEIKLTITALSPLAVGKKKPGSVSEAEDYIRGSVIRGAIASYLIELLGKPEPTDQFYQLFVNENSAIFRNAYPAKHLLPTTAVSAKNKPGFKPKGEGVFDTLIDRFCAESRGLLYDPCSEDGGRVEPFNAFYDQKNNNNYETKSVSKRLLTRAGINRHRATSEEEILYSIEVLNEVQTKDKKTEPTTFYSSILLDNQQLADELSKLLTNTELIRFGGSTSRGLGKVRFTAKKKNAVTEVKKNLDSFNQKLTQRWQQWQILNSTANLGIQNKTFFTINLQSDSIFQENWQRTMVISPEMLRQFAKIQDQSLTLHTSYSSYDYRSGWNSAWGLRKDVELITNKGSVYLFSTENIDLWIEPLTQLSLTGIGERIAEGFGQILICDPFHLILQEELI